MHCCACFPGLRQRVALVAWQLCVPWFCPEACLSGVLRGPVLMRRASCRPVALRAPVGFPDSVVRCRTESCALPVLLGGRARHVAPGRKLGSWCLLLARAAAGALGSFCVVTPGAPLWGCPWRVPSALVSGCVRCGNLACVDPRTHTSGFACCLPFDRDAGRCTRAVSC